MLEGGTLSHTHTYLDILYIDIISLCMDNITDEHAMRDRVYHWVGHLGSNKDRLTRVMLDIKWITLAAGHKNALIHTYYKHTQQVYCSVYIE